MGDASPNARDLELPPGLGEVLKQIVSVTMIAEQPHVIGLVQQLLPALMFSSAQTLMTVLGASLPKCNIISPPKDVFVTIDSTTHNYRMECKHSPPHCWELSGKNTSC